jgi:pyruvate ferredoxin oxidoreductase delta subunit
MAVQPISFPQEGVSGITGNWRSQRPVLNKSECKKCLICWSYCPEACIDKESLEINYTYCKGCGICAAECPFGAIAFEEEDAQ